MFLLNGDNDDIMEKITNCAAVLWTVVRVIMLCLLVIVIISRYYVYILISAFLDRAVIMIGIVVAFIMMLAKSNLIMM